jgi:hypothetical protein
VEVRRHGRDDGGRRQPRHARLPAVRGRVRPVRPRRFTLLRRAVRRRPRAGGAVAVRRDQPR